MQARAEAAVTGLADDAFEAEAIRDRAGPGFGLRLRRLGEVDEAAVIAEIGLLQLRMPVDAERADDQAVEMTQQEVRQVERAGLRLRERGEDRRLGVELVAMRAGDALDALLAQDGVEFAPRAAIGVGDEDLGMAAAMLP